MKTGANIGVEVTASREIRPIGRRHRGAFTLIELMVATLIGLVLAGDVVALLYQSAVEQKRGASNVTVEGQAYVLENTIKSCIRSMSANQGITPDYTTGATDSSGNFLGYQTVYLFLSNTNSTGGYTTARIHFNSATGQVMFTPNMANPTNPVIWITNSPTLAVRKLCFSPSLNADGSLNSSLVNVRLQLDDNGASMQNPTNNPASIYRSFSVQMRSN